MRYRLHTLMTQFTIRDVLWLTLLVGALLGWQVDRRRLDEMNRELIKDRDAKQRLADLRQREIERKVLIGREP